MKGEELADLIEEWLNKNSVHPDDFNMLFANELLDLMCEDKK